MRIRIACWDYDRVSALRDGRARIDGAEVEFTVLSPHGFFFRSDDAEFDVIEQSMSSYLRARSLGSDRYTAIPVYPSRMFRHSAIYIRADSGIREPADLANKRLGVPYYGITAAMTARGILRDEYGLRPGDVRWVEAPLEQGETLPGYSTDLPVDVAIEHRPGDNLAELLLDGAIDGIVSAAWPSCYHGGSGRVTRLFPDLRKVEAAYFARTGIFPIMHVLGIRNDLLAGEPSLAKRVYRAFCEAKALSDENLDGTGGAVMATLPWMVQEIEATIAAMGEDFWPYGIHRNRATLDAMTRWSFEQGLSVRRLAIDELFATSALDDRAVEMARKLRSS